MVARLQERNYGIVSLNVHVTSAVLICDQPKLFVALSEIQLKSNFHDKLLYESVNGSFTNNTLFWLATF